MRFLLPFLLLTAVACGTDDEVEGGDDASVSERDAGADVISDMAVDEADDVTAVDGASPADSGSMVDAPDLGTSIYPIIEEEEPNSQRSDANAFTTPATLRGSVDREDDPVDWWEVNVPGPSILEITIEGGEVAWIEVQTTDVRKRGLSGPPGAMREFFVPAPGRYQIGIITTEENPAFAYSVTVRSYEATAEPLEGDTTTGDLDDGRVDVYSWFASGNGFTIAEIIGAREPVSSGIDSFLFVQDQTTGTFEANDDAMSGGTKDSRLDFERRDGAEYWIAVDVYEPTEDHRYELRLQSN